MHAYMNTPCACTHTCMHAHTHTPHNTVHYIEIILVSMQLNMLCCAIYSAHSRYLSMLVSNLKATVRDSLFIWLKNLLYRYTQKLCRAWKSDLNTHCMMYSTIRFTCVARGVGWSFSHSVSTRTRSHSPVY